MKNNYVEEVDEEITAPVEISFKGAASKIDTYFSTLVPTTAFVRAYGFIDGLLISNALKDGDASRLYAYSGQIYCQKTRQEVIRMSSARNHHIRSHKTNYKHFTAAMNACHNHRAPAPKTGWFEKLRTFVRTMFGGRHT